MIDIDNAVIFRVLPHLCVFSRAIAVSHCFNLQSLFASAFFFSLETDSCGIGFDVANCLETTNKKKEDHTLDFRLRQADTLVGEVYIHFVNDIIRSDTTASRFYFCEGSFLRS